MKKSAMIAVVGLGALFSCDLGEDEYLGPIQSKIEVTMVEDLSYEEPFFQIIFETANLYDCANYNIQMIANASESQLDIVFNEIYKDNSCNSATGPAYNAYTFTKIVNGVYDISLQVKGKSAVAGTLTITDSAYTLDMEQSEDFEFVNPHLFSMPKGILWGSIQTYSDNQQTDDVVDKFYTQLADLKLADTLLAEGDYTYFTVGNKNEVTLRRTGAGSSAEVTSFVYFINEDSVSRNDLKVAISDFRGIYSDYVDINMFDWDGTIY